MKYPVWKRELPKFPHKMYNEPLEKLLEFYKEHIRRDVNSGKLLPAGFWEVARLFLISAMQTYAAICILLADNRPKRLILQAGILNRSLLETQLGVVLNNAVLVKKSIRRVMGCLGVLAR